ncbi:MAG: hypothetical protein WD402_00890 [Chloroflexota bacterium]
MRWTAAVVWIAVAAYYLSIFLFDQFRTINDLGPTVACLAIAVLIAVGRRLGQIAALLGAGLAVMAVMAALAFEDWRFAAAFVAVVVVNLLAVREINRDLGPPR